MTACGRNNPNFQIDMYKIFLAWKYLLSRKIIFLAIGGIAVGVMALIVVTSVMGGFAKEMRERIRGTSAHLNITSGDSYFIYDATKIIDRIKDLPEISGYAPRVEWGALFGNGLEFVQIVGIEPQLEKTVNNYEKYLLPGTSLLFPDNDEKGLPPVIVGNQLVMASGRTIFLTSMKFQSGMAMPTRKEFRVVGAFSTGMFEYDSNIYMPLKAAQDFLGVNEGVTKIALSIKDYRQAAEVKAKISGIIESYGSFNIKTWEEEKRNLLRAVATEKTINAFLLFFIVVVAAFNILALLTMRVVEKTKDIGILLSLGGKPSGIAWLFIWQGLLIAFLGSIAGVISGYLLAYYLNPIEETIAKVTGFKLFPSDIYMLEKIPSEISYFTIIVIIIATFAVSLLFSIYPAIKAAKLNPVDALRYE